MRELETFGRDVPMNIWDRIIDRLAEKIKMCQDPSFGIYLAYGILDRDGKVVAADVAHNRYFRSGASLVLSTVYRNESVLPVAFYGRLYNVAPTDTDTLASLAPNEVSGFGYAPQSWNRNTTDWGAVQFNSSINAMVTIGVGKTFTASGGSWSIRSFVLATTADNTGTAFAYVTFASTLTILDGQSFFAQPIGAERGATF